MKTLDQAGPYDELLQRLMGLRADSTRQWGTMSANQMVCHLTDSFCGVMGLKHLSTRDNLFTRTVMKWGGLWVPLTWPKNLPTLPEMDQTLGGTPPTEFVRDVVTMRTTMQRFRQAPRDFDFGKHPLFGLMSDREWMRWGYLHVDHHLRQFGV